MEFNDYVAARRPALVRTVVLLGCPQSDAEDIVQTALARCLRHWRRVQRADRPEAYVHKVLVNTLANARRRRWNAEVPTELLPETEYEPDVTAGLAVRQALAAMDSGQREVLVLRYFADLSEREIADLLGIAPGTVKSRASRGIAALAASLRSPDVC
ncbi:MAG: SigE family RNA polymerase sigma factor [Nocardioidaceae bacterium]